MKFIELFAGAGGLGLGLQAAGMHHLLSVERGKAPHSVLVGAGHYALRMDLKDVGNACIAMRQRPDIVVGGPPCQDFSTFGSRTPGENALMTVHYAQIICIIRPSWFLFENVPRAAISSEYRSARALWKRAGYGLTELVVNAMHYGVPQDRKRFICIGRLDERDQFLKREIESSSSPTPMTVRDMLDPKHYPEDAGLLQKGIFFSKPWMGGKDQPNRRGIRSIDEQAGTVTSSFHKRVSSDAYTPHPRDAGSFADVHWLSLSQIARIQGFPQNYDFRGKNFGYSSHADGWSDEKVALMIANAVPAPLAKALGQCIVDRHQGYSIPELDKEFSAFLRKKRSKPGEKPISDEGIANIRSRVNRARRMIEGRQYANLALEIQALEGAFEAETGKFFADFDKRLQSDLRQGLGDFYEYLEKTQRPSGWAPPPPKPATFRKPAAKKSRRPKLPTLGSISMPTTPHPLPMLNLNKGRETPFDEIFDDGFPLDYHPGLEPASEHDWRPEGYWDPDPEDLED